jgi:fatty acid elongase 3
LLAHSSESNYSMVFQPDLWDWKSILKPQEFEWTIGTTPMSNLGVVTYAWVCYFTILMFLKFMVRQYPNGLSIKWIVALHNLVLMIASVAMFLASAIPLYEIITNLGFDAWCSADKVTPRKGLAYWSIYVFYLSKFYELLDTAILVVKKVDLNN